MTASGVRFGMDSAAAQSTFDGGAQSSVGWALAAPLSAGDAGWARSGGKRFFDVLVASAALVVLFPLLVLIAVAIRIDSAGPVLFRQERCGRLHRSFTILKFRTMFAGSDQIAVTAANLAEPPLMKFGENDPRLTRLGRLLRRHALDELPQLVNVLRGEMSIVGPRPFVVHESDALPSWSEARQIVRPGITGPWQAAGTHSVALVRMLEMDCRYVSGASCFGDVRILARTLHRVVSPVGTQ